MTPALLAKARTATQSWLGVGTSCPVPPTHTHPKARLASGPWEGCSKSGRAWAGVRAHVTSGSQWPQEVKELSPPPGGAVGDTGKMLTRLGSAHKSAPEHSGQCQTQASPS